MSDMSEIIRKRALIRVARIFNVPVAQLQQDFVFGQDLVASKKAGLFRRNEYDQIEGDIYDVADRKIYKELSSGLLEIRTVGDYCSHMARCYETKPADVNHVLRDEKAPAA